MMNITKPASSLVLPIVLSFVALLVMGALSLLLGALKIPLLQVIESFTNFDAHVYEHRIIRELRLPRTIVGIGVGAALALAGTGMQGITANPLSGPSILGVNSGAAFAIVLASKLFGAVNPIGHFWFAFLGGIVAFACVLLISVIGGKGISPGKMVLAGVVISSMCSAWTSAALILDKETLDTVRFWMAGSISGRGLDIFKSLVLILVLSALGMIVMSSRINILSMGEDRAKSLGMNTSRVRVITALLAVCLASASVSIAGPIGFVGLAVPHMIRRFNGGDYRGMVFFSLLLGPVFLLATDITGRLVAAPAEIQVGIITALVGAPMLIAIARSRRMRFA